jgi:FMN reductase (NADPH)/FMN reductase [NAD(P)H]
MFEQNEKRVSPKNVYGAKNFGQFLYARKFGSDCLVEMERSINVMLKHWKTKE